MIAGVSVLTAAALMVPYAGPTSADPQACLEMLEAVRVFQDSLWDSPGFAVEETQSVGSDTVDLRSGYSREGSGLTDWAGGEYTPIEDSYTDARALDLMGAQAAQWVWTPPGSDTWSNPIFTTTPLTWLILDGPTPGEVTSTSQIRDGAGSTWTMNTSDGPFSVGVTATQLKLRFAQRRLTWTIGEHAIPTPSAESVVASSDADEAGLGLRQLDAVPGVVSAVRKAAKRSNSPVRTLRRTARRAIGEQDLTVRDVSGGVQVGARSRYVDRVWRITWDAGRNALVVKNTDRHPVGWLPPRVPVNVLPPTPPTEVGKQAVRALSAGVVGALRTPGVRISFGGLRYDPKVPGGTGALDYTNGFAGMFASDGSLAAVAGRNRECYVIQKPNSAMTKKVLRRAGKPRATWSCTAGGDTELGWLPAFGPIGSLTPTSRILYTSEVQLTETDSFKQFALGTGTGEVALSFEGGLLTSLTLGTFGEEGQSGVRLGYAYGPLNLRLPPVAQRVSLEAVWQAEDSLRAPKVVRKAAANARRCARKRIASGSRPLPAIRRCAADVMLRQAPHLLLEAVPMGVRLFVDTRYSRDSREVLWTGSRVVITNVVHRVKR